MSRDLVAACLACLACLEVAHAAPGATSGPELWKRFDVRGVRLGMSRAELVKRGFKCGENPNSKCLKIDDARCKGHACEFDDSDNVFKRDGAQIDLDYIVCETTPTDAALVWHIKAGITPRQLLTPTSVLGKAITAKYGPPDGKNDLDPHDTKGGGFWSWRLGDGNATLNCSTPQGEYDSPGYRTCYLELVDHGVERLEDQRQDQRNQQKRDASQPTAAPAL